MHSNIKIHILFRTVGQPSGGGNQFLRALKKFFASEGFYSDSVEDADVILFNSHHHTAEAGFLKVKYPQKIFLHRIDGPMGLYSGLRDGRDKLVFNSNRLLADATVFQSGWSQKRNCEIGLVDDKPSSVIINAADAEVFNRSDRSEFSTERKICIIATSWSSNWKKGFNTYKWLDENLDFQKYTMTFVGNSPIRFKNILCIAPLPSLELAKKLKASDIFITASQDDPCSNSLIEALNCGLPALAFNSGGHPEIIGSGGELFKTPQQIPLLLNKIVGDYDAYVKNIKVPAIEKVGRQYYDFACDVAQSEAKGFGIFKYIRLVSVIFTIKVLSRLKRIFR
ncbi:MAG: glycosyltransferase [Anaerohalosphaeraceae bacterium]|nr:glycosyltransferase [Anaerohalosphaeraceae bacterium]